MTPNDGLAFGGTDYLLANPGESYIVYADDLTGQLGIEAMAAGQYDLRWFDVVTGTTVVENNVLLPAGDQTFTTPGGIGSELALWVTVALPPGDFDTDGDVDGADFLFWQRNRAVGDLSAWEANFGNTSAFAAAASIPEPSSLLFMAASLLLMTGRRKTGRAIGGYRVREWKRRTKRTEQRRGKFPIFDCINRSD